MRPIRYEITVDVEENGRVYKSSRPTQIRTRKTTKNAQKNVKNIPIERSEQGESKSAQINTFIREKLKIIPETLQNY